jgi:hypothetical protein
MKPTNPSSHGARGHQLHPPEEMHNEGVAHERSDIDIRAIVASILALFTICVTVVLLMGGLFKLLDYRAAQDDPPVSPVARPASVMPRTTADAPTFGTAAGPRLLTNEPVALERQRETERQVLQGYAWTNQAAGVARIPIDEAKKLIAARGLPPPDGAQPEAGTWQPARGESSSGRLVDGPPRGAGLPVVTGAAAPSAPHQPPQAPRH